MKKRSALKPLDYRKIGRRMRAMIDVQYDHVSQFAEAVGLSRNSMYKILHGSSCPETQTLVDVCELLGCSMDFLLGLSSPERDPMEGFEAALLNIREFRGSWSGRKKLCLINAILGRPARSDIYFLRRSAPSEKNFRNPKQPNLDTPNSGH